MPIDENSIDWSRFNFTKEELADERTGELGLAPGFLDRLQELRIDYDHGMIVTNGCRAGSTNRWLLDRGYPASENSFHLIVNPKYKTGGCCAVDVARPNGVFFHKLIKAATALDWSIGIGKTFIHLDLRFIYSHLPTRIYTY